MERRQLQWQLVFACLLLVVSGTSATLTCYDCTPDMDASQCDTSRNCTGAACLIFQPSPGERITAFCLLGLGADGAATKDQDGCWTETDGKGRHCMCHESFCNKPLDPRLTEDTLPMHGARLLPSNPLVDYSEDGADGTGDQKEDEDEIPIAGAVARPPPALPLFPAAAEADRHTAGGGGDDSEDDKDGAVDDDLVPIDFADYDRATKEQLIERNKPALAGSEAASDSMQTPPTAAAPPAAPHIDGIRAVLEEHVDHEKEPEKEQEQAREDEEEEEEEKEEAAEQEGKAAQTRADWSSAVSDLVQQQQQQPERDEREEKLDKSDSSDEARDGVALGEMRTAAAGSHSLRLLFPSILLPLLLLLNNLYR